jgi:hypothetical protein
LFIIAGNETYEVTEGEIFRWRRPSELAQKKEHTKVFPFVSISC